jgi:hypothetical protein
LDKYPVAPLGNLLLGSEETKQPVHREILRHFLESRGRPITTPGPILGSFYDADTYRVEHHVTAQLQKIVIFLRQDGFVSPLKDVSGPVVSSAVSLGIDAIDLPHPSGEIGVRCFNQDVIVVIHEAIGMAEPIIALYDNT